MFDIIIQVVHVFSGKKRVNLIDAMHFIGERKVDGGFSKRALKLQKKYHSTISILRKLRRQKNIIHLK